MHKSVDRYMRINLTNGLYFMHDGLMWCKMPSGMPSIHFRSTYALEDKCICIGSKAVETADTWETPQSLWQLAGCQAGMCSANWLPKYTFDLSHFTSHSLYVPARPINNARALLCVSDLLLPKRRVSNLLRTEERCGIAVLYHLCDLNAHHCTNHFQLQVVIRAGRIRLAALPFFLVAFICSDHGQSLVVLLQTSPLH